ncbi:LytR C-terminal domain-containing protein [Modestobacter lapidis]
MPVPANRRTPPGAGAAAPTTAARPPSGLPPRQGSSGSTGAQPSARPATSGPDTDANAETLPRRSRAERRREGLLPAGEDPLLRRLPGTPPRPAPSTPPGGGRRRSDQSGGTDVPAPGSGVPTSVRPAVGRRPVPGWGAGTATPGSAAPAPRLHDSGPQPVVRAGRASWPTENPLDRSAPATSSAPSWTPPPAPPTPPDGRGPATSFAPVAGPPSAPLTSLAPVAGPPSAPLTSLAPVAGPPSAPLTSLGPATSFDPISPPPVSPRTGERPTPGPGRRTGDGIRSGSFPAQPAAWVPATVVPAAPRHDEYDAPRYDHPRHDAPHRDAPHRDAPHRDAPHRDAARHDAPTPVPGPASGPVGGRAAARLERQAAEAAARKAGRHGGAAAGPSPAAPRRSAVAEREGERTGAPRRAVQLMLAMVIVSLVVLGVWSFTSPRTDEVSSGTPAEATEQVAAEPSADAPAEAAPPADVVPSAAAVPPGPVRAPVTVLNSTRITGLAASIAEQIGAGGWQTLEPATYEAADVAVTTVFYTEGDAVQQAAAEQLIAQFPDVIGPAPRFFEVPGVPDPGLVVVATGNWQP